MKVAYATVERLIKNPSLLASGYANLPMIQRMPVDVTICTDAEQLRQCAGDMDVVLLELPGALPYRDDLAFLNELPCYVAGFHLDTWKGPFWCDQSVDVSLNICVYREITLRIKPKVAEKGEFLWLPPRVQVYNMNGERDLDVIYWGHQGREYPFRLYAYYALLNIIAAGPRIPDPGMRHEYKRTLRLHDISLNGGTYRFGRILSSYGDARCHGKELAEILHRSKICPTGPPIHNRYAAPVARYIENAACGVVSLTTEFDEMEDLGFEHGENIWITTAPDFYNDLGYLLKNDDHRIAMGNNAKAMVEQRHTVRKRSEELYQVLNDRINKGELNDGNRNS